MKKRFGHSKIDFNKFSKKHFILSVLIGLVSAFVIYSFSSVLRESLRLMTIHDGLEPMIIDGGRRYLLNLFFAALSLIYGSSITIAVFFSNQRSLLPGRSNKRKRILNDQVFINMNFAYVLFQLLTMFGIFYFGEVYLEPFKRELVLVIILLLLVLFLESWKSLIQVLGQRRWIYQFVHLIVIVLLSLGLSQINIVDHKSIDKNLLKNNPIVNKPHSEFRSEIIWRHRTIDFKLTHDINGDLVININRERIQLSDLRSQIRVERASWREELIPYLTVRIIADKNVQLIKLKEFEAELFAAGQYCIIYEVEYGSFNSRSSFSGIRKRITKDAIKYLSHNSKMILIPPPPNFENVSFNDTISIPISNQKMIDNKVISNAELTELFRENISRDVAFQYDMTSESSYQNYIEVLSMHNKVVNELRRKEQTIFRESQYQIVKGFREEQKKLKDKYPLIILEDFIE